MIKERSIEWYAAAVAQNPSGRYTANALGAQRLNHDSKRARISVDENGPQDEVWKRSFIDSFAGLFV